MRRAPVDLLGGPLYVVEVEKGVVGVEKGIVDVGWGIFGVDRSMPRVVSRLRAFLKESPERGG